MQWFVKSNCFVKKLILVLSDINECDTVLGACSQICENTVGSFECSCINGFKSMLKNPNHCVIASGKVGIIFAHQTDLRLLDISTKETSVIVEGELSATHLVGFIYSSKNSIFIHLGLSLSGKASVLD